MSVIEDEISFVTSSFTRDKEVKLCLEDILKTIEAPRLPPIDGDSFQCENPLLQVYLVNSKEAEICRVDGCMVFCEYCGDTEEYISGVRGGGGVDELCVQNHGISFCCLSCCEEDAEPQNMCASCGIHNNLLCNEEETMMSQDHFEYLALYRSPGFCPHCMVSLTRSELMNIIYSREHWLHPGSSQDLSGPPSVRRRLDFPESSDSDDDLELTDDEDYEEEYENEESPENNTENAKEIKDAVKDIGEKIFDIQDKLREGDYLEIMNLLQKVTNNVNRL